MSEHEVQKLTIDMSGSFPWQFSADDAKKAGKTILLVAAGAVLTYIGGTIIPALHTDSPVYALVVSGLAGLIDAAQRWVSDTRSAQDKARLPYKEYLRIRALKS